MKYWFPDEIEQLTRRRLNEYEANTACLIPWPRVPIEQIIENEPFDLAIKWERIEERPGERILGALRPHERQIVLNEAHQALFDAKPGLERFTLGHELGHWDLFVNEYAMTSALLPGLDLGKQPYAFRIADEGLVQVLFAMMDTKAEAYELAQELQSDSRRDSRSEKSAVDQYSSSLLMCRESVAHEVSGFDLTQWPTIYQLAERFGVTPTACKVRLEQLSYIFVKDKTIYRSREEYSGQKAFSF
jgi:Zn-dependent peptidase ImmA (M78 family)